MSEDDQRSEIQMTQSLCDDLVRKVVDMVASGQHSVIHALMDNFKIKDGMVTVTAKGMADDGAVLALNSVGKKAIKIVVADAEQFDADGYDAEADPDQPSMLPDEHEGSNDHVSDDEIFKRAVDIVVKDQKCSTSYIQRKLAIGYNRAARLIERMEKEGIVSASNDVGKRDILFTSADVDAEIDDMAKDMDDALDGMEEPDDMHDDQTGDEPEPESEPVSDEQVAGYHARMQGQPLSSGPDIDSPERDDWYLGWKKADGEDGAPDIAESAVNNEPDEPTPSKGEPTPQLNEPEVAPDDQDVEDNGAPEADAEKGDPVDPEPTPEADPDPAADDGPDLGGLSPKDHGAQCRLKGGGKDDDPFDGGTDESAEWLDGYDYADGEVKQIQKMGHDAAASGADIGSSKWKAGSDAERFWLEGFNSFKPDS